MEAVEDRARTPESVAGDKETGRVEAFSDGVFAIAITLLVLNLSVPSLDRGSSSRALLALLGQQWPSYVAFVTSFVTVLIMWMNHHAMFRLVRRADAQLMLANGFLLLLVTAVPFPTALVADYLTTPAASIACAVYGGVFVLQALAFNILMRVVLRDLPRVQDAAAQARARHISGRYRLGVPAYLAATLLAFWQPYLTIVICLALWGVWVLTVLERRPAGG